MFPVLKLIFTYVLFVLNKNKHKYPVKGTQTYTRLLNITHVSAEDWAPNPCNMWTLNYLMSGKTEQVSPHGQVLTFSGEEKIDFCGYFSSLFFSKASPWTDTCAVLSPAPLFSAEPQKLQNAPGVHHQSCWKTAQIWANVSSTSFEGVKYLHSCPNKNLRHKVRDYNKTSIIKAKKLTQRPQTPI